MLLLSSCVLLACSSTDDAIESEPSDVTSPIVVDGALCRVEYAVSSQAASSFSAAVKVVNKTSAQISNWKLTWSFPNGQQLTSVSRGRYTQTGSQVEMAGTKKNANLAAGASTAFSFSATYSGSNGDPSKFYLNGLDCGGVVTDTSSGGAGTGGSGSTGGGFSSIVSSSLWTQLFPNRNSLYGYDALVTATKAYPAFASEGTLEQQKREVAAFLANIAHETTGGWATAPGGPYAWGLYYTEEIACASGGCSYCSPNATYPCRSGQSYHGRGPMQLTWNYNYGQAGQALGLDLLGNPNLVKTDSVVSFKTAVWFWMTAQTPKPSAHAVMSGKWTPSSYDTSVGRYPGFGMTVNIINGGVECNHGVDSSVKDRIGYYQAITAALGVSQGSYVDCYSMVPY